jgi:hypothetical protein
VVDLVLPLIGDGRASELSVWIYLVTAVSVDLHSIYFLICY